MGIIKIIISKLTDLAKKYVPILPYLNPSKILNKSADESPILICSHVLSLTAEKIDIALL